MQFIVISIATWLSIVVTQTTTLAIFEIGQSNVYSSVHASVAGVDSSDTTLVLNCQPDPPETVCDIASPLTITEGPSTFALRGVYVATNSDNVVTVTIRQDCKITGSVVALCTASKRLETIEGGISTSTDTKIETTLTSCEFTYGPITVTAGFEKLRQPQASTSVASTQKATEKPTQNSTQTPTTSAGRSEERLAVKEAVFSGVIIAFVVTAMLQFDWTHMRL